MRRAYNNFIERHEVAWELAMAYQAGGVLLIKSAAILVTLAVLVLSAARFPKLVVLGGATATAFGLLGLLLNSVSIAIAHG